MEQSHGKCLKKQLEISEALSEVQEELLHDHIQLQRDYERLDAEFRQMSKMESDDGHRKCLKKQLELGEAHEELLRDHIQLRVKYDQLEAEVKDLRHIVDAMLGRRACELKK